MLRRSVAARKHVFSQGGNHHFGWQNYPRDLYNGALSVPAVPMEPTYGGTRKMVGSGIWGPENADVMKLALYNRLRQRKYQREVPSLETMQSHNTLENAILWWCFGATVFMGPLLWWSKKYRMIHEAYPWMPKRIDGTRGAGEFCWFIQ